MADPVSVACAAAQFVGLAGQLIQGVQYFRRQCQGIRTAPKLIKRIYAELRIIESTLEDFRTLEISEDVAKGFIATLEGCKDILEDIFDLVFTSNLLDESQEKRTYEKLWKQVVANGNRPKFEDYLRRLERMKSSMLAAMSGLQIKRTKKLQDDISNNASQMGNSFTRVETNLNRIEATLSRTETGITRVETGLDDVRSGFTSITMLSEQTYTNSRETKDDMQSLAKVMRSIDNSLQDMKNDMPQMIEEGMQRCLEDRLVEWKDNWERDHSTRKVLHRDQPQKRLRLDSKPPSKAYLNLKDPPRSLVNSERAGIAFARKKIFTRNIALPFGFIQTKATRRIVHEVTETGLVIEREILRMEISILPFRWLSSKGHYLSVQKALDQSMRPSWTVTPRTYHIVPKDSMIMLACENRDLDAIRKLFEYHQASPFDVDNNGSSLLAHSVAKFNEGATPEDMAKIREVISFLTSHGADPTGFLGDLLDRHHHYSFDRWILQYDSAEIKRDYQIQQVIEEIWSLCLERCHADPFADMDVLEKLWNTSMGGQIVPPLDPSYLFHDRYSGLDDLVFEHPDRVFWNLMDAQTWCKGPDANWEQLIDQKYETMVYLCNGGKDSIKASIFSPQYAATIKWRTKDSCYCPSNGTHLLCRLLDCINLEVVYRRSRRKPMLEHIRRMLLLLLQDGENPRAKCSCPARWQQDGYSRSPTDIAAERGVLSVWTEALEECGIDSWSIIQDWQYDGISSLFHQESDEVVVETPSGKQGFSERVFRTSTTFFAASVSAISALSCWLLWIGVSSLVLCKH